MLLGLWCGNLKRSLEKRLGNCGKGSIVTGALYWSVLHFSSRDPTLTSVGGWWGASTSSVEGEIIISFQLFVLILEFFILLLT